MESPEASGDNRHKKHRSPSNKIPGGFNRMIWLGSLDKTISKEALALFIKEEFDILPSQIDIQNLFSVRNRAVLPKVSFKISVDSEDTFNSLIDQSKWPRKYRVKEFFRRSPNTSINSVASNDGDPCDFIRYILD